MAKEEKVEVDVKGIKNEEGLKYFAQALPSVLAKSDTKAVIKAASEGDLDKYKEAIKNLKLKRITDYNFVLVIFSPIVAVAKALKRGKLGWSYGNSSIVAGYLSRLLGRIEFKVLCEKIGAGEGPTIKDSLERVPGYKEFLGVLSDSKYGKNGDQFMQRAAAITPWKVNGKYVRQKLIPFVEKVFDSKYANAVRKGLPKGQAPVPNDPEPKSDISEEYDPSYAAPTGSKITFAELLLEIKDGHFEHVPLDKLNQSASDVIPTLDYMKPILKFIQEAVQNEYKKVKGFRDKTKRKNFIDDFDTHRSNIKDGLSTKEPVWSTDGSNVVNDSAKLLESLGDYFGCK